MQGTTTLNMIFYFGTVRVRGKRDMYTEFWLRNLGGPLTDGMISHK